MSRITKHRKAPNQSAATLRDLSDRHAQILAAVWFTHGLSRSDLHSRTGIRLRTVGTLVDDLIKWQFINEGPPRVTGVGRPQVPLEVRGDGATLIGLTIVPGEISIASTDLRGITIHQARMQKITDTERLIPATKRLLGEFLETNPIAIGVSLSGFVDDRADQWLMSSAHPTQDALSLSPLRQAAGEIPIVINNELHAMSAAARLRGDLPRGDTLLVHLEDGRLAASILVDGKPNRGSVLAANELGHMTMPVKTHKCYCGQVGCAERIFSSEYLQIEPRVFSSMIRSGAFDASAKSMFDLTGRAIANAINFVRPGTLVISTSLEFGDAFQAKLQQAIRKYCLKILHERLEIRWQVWNAEMSAAAAAMLPMSNALL